MIEEKILRDSGAVLRKYKKDQSIFYEGDKAMFYFQIIKGSIKVVSVSDAGKEFIQGIFKDGDSFGEPVLLIDEPYPASAVANEDSIILKLDKGLFLNILKKDPDIHFRFSQLLAKRLYHKSIIVKEISTSGPEHRVFSVLKIFKKTNHLNGKDYKVELSRQQIADMTGLRVETVIRYVKKLQEKKLIKIEKGKIYM